MKNTIKGDFDKEQNYHAIMRMAEKEKKPKKRIYFSIGLVAVCMMIAVFVWSPGNEGMVDKNGAEIFINEVDLRGAAKLDADVVYEDEKKLIGETRDEGTSLFAIPEIEGMIQRAHYFLYTREGDGPYDILHDEIYDFQSADGSKEVHLAISDKGNPLRDYFFGDSAKIPSKIKGIEVTIAGMEQSYYALFQIGDIYIDIETNGVSQNQMVEIIKDIITRNKGAVA